MKTIKLLKLQIENFKGISNGTFAFNGENTEIVADIMQGKSTIKDAYLWCFGIEVDNFYPIDKNNRLIDGLETTVTTMLDVDGIEYSLSRSAKVKYKNKVFDGYKKDMFEFDGIPCNTTEYKSKLCELLGVSDFDTLKYLSVLNYFNEQVNWKERRNLIYHLFADKNAISNLKNDAKYELISTELKKGKTSADISTVLNSENNRLVENKRRNEILLADKQHELSNYANINYDNIEKELEEVEKNIKEEQEKIDGYGNEEIKHSLLAQIYELTKEKVKLEEENIKQQSTIQQAYFKAKKEVEPLKNECERAEKQIEGLTEQYNNLKTLQFDENSTICPTCQQRLPQARIDELRQNWANTQDAKLTSLKDTILGLKQQYLTLKDNYTNKLAHYVQSKRELEEYAPNPRIEELDTELENLKNEIENLKAQAVDTSYLDELKSRRNFLIAELGKKYSQETLKTKIEALTTEQRDLANAEILLLQKRSQLEQYVLDIISLVNDSINKHFDGIEFKLFEELTATASKSIKETVVCLNNGIDYVSQSTGQKAISNCIVVSTLQNALGVNMPIWLDDASILNLKKEPTNQLIYLLNEKGKKLDCVKISEIY